MKLLSLFLVLMVLTSSALAVPRSSMLGVMQGHEKRYLTQKVGAEEGTKEESKAHTVSSIENHHNIPRQNYDNSGTTGDGHGGGSV